MPTQVLELATPEPSTVEIWSMWNTLMGDPATDFWTGVPGDLVVEHPADLSTGAAAVPVTVTSDGAPVAGAVVCADPPTTSATLTHRM